MVEKINREILINLLKSFNLRKLSEKADLSYNTVRRLTRRSQPLEHLTAIVAYRIAKALNTPLETFIENIYDLERR